MSRSIQAKPSKESLIMLDTLKTAVTHALERKRRLGQYAVVWRNGKPTQIEGDAITVSDNKSQI